ncbi:MAG: Ig-like domain-containing protein [Nitrospirae bacterium]|nr:Ig-like domain-containing protein [Nitrospirota bacterium]
MNLKVGRRLWVGFFLVGLLTFAGCASIPSDPSTSGTDKPRVISTFPGGGEYNVSRFAQLEIRFSHLMDSGHLPGFEMFGGGMTVEGRLRWLDPMTLVFRPDEPLKAGISYQCVLSEGRSKAGEELIGIPYIWVFTAGD